MTQLFPNYNSTHSGKTASNNMFNGSQSGKGLQQITDAISSIMALF